MIFQNSTRTADVVPGWRVSAHQRHVPAHDAVIGVRSEAFRPNLLGKSNADALGVVFVSKSHFYELTKSLLEMTHAVGNCKEKAYAIVKNLGRGRP